MKLEMNLVFHRCFDVNISLVGNQVDVAQLLARWLDRLQVDPLGRHEKSVFVFDEVASACRC